MQQLKRYSVVFLLLLSTFSYGQNSEVVKKYIETYKDLAMHEMLRTGVPAAITLAQGIHESGAGNSKLAAASNNHFGIKCKSNWTGETVKHDDDARGECFRKYPSAEDSYKDHSDFLKNGARYASLFMLDPEDYTAWANGLKNAGYATNPKYPQVLIKLIEDYSLQQYSLMALGKTKDTAVVTSASGELTVTTVVDGAADFLVARHSQVNYPFGEFKINDTKVIYVQRGTFFLALAKQYDISLSKFFEINDMAEAEQADKDQLIYLQRKRKTGANEFHIVQPGETLHAISQSEAIRLENLMELNLLKEGQVPAVGEKLHLKTKAPSAPLLALKENYSLTPAKQPK
ncbi:MAG: LysM peptidoglycan-binding domain-containing protein [Chitinophagaceae bacterium]|nr:LysM peptidoglycan-binding domain-containing protein [Chitinophagaceae bacterium]